MLLILTPTEYLEASVIILLWMWLILTSTLYFVMLRSPNYHLWSVLFVNTCRQLDTCWLYCENILSKFIYSSVCYRVLEFSTLFKVFLWAHIIVLTVDYSFVLVYMNIMFYHCMLSNVFKYAWTFLQIITYGLYYL
jgi:hypothetical protein